MRPLLVIPVLFLWAHSFSQNEIIELVFKDKSNFDITTLLDNKKPTKFFVLATTDKWNSYRFHLDAKQMLERDEHSRYIHSYLFKDTTLERIISDSEKMHLYQLTQITNPRPLRDHFKEFALIKSFDEAKNGFFFSITDPIFTTDKLYGFIDITIYKKDKETKELNYAYFGHTLLIYQNLKDKGWVRMKKIDYLIL